MKIITSGWVLYQKILEEDKSQAQTTPMIWKLD